MRRHNQTLKFEVEPKMLVSELKRKISGHQGIPISNMVLVSNGEFMRDDKTLAQIKLRRKNIIVQAYLETDE